jgi:hypothetical protein
MQNREKWPPFNTASYLDMPVPIRAVSEGRPVWLVNAGLGGCLCECDHRVVGLRDVDDLTDFEPLTLWLAAVERRARRKRRWVKLPTPVDCIRRDTGDDPVSLSGVGSDGMWVGCDEDERPVRFRLPEVVVWDKTEDYLWQICEVKRFWAGMGTGRAA